MLWGPQPATRSAIQPPLEPSTWRSSFLYRFITSVISPYVVSISVDLKSFGRVHNLRQSFFIGTMFATRNTSLQIKTNCVRNSAGCIVSGLVCLHLGQPFEVDHLAITLSGRAQTDIDQSSPKAPGCVFQGQRIFFARKKTLIKDSVEIRESCSWRFEFRIPDRCTARQAQRFRHWERFDDNPQQRLPPGFASSCAKGDGSSAANAAIIYELKASLVAKDFRLEALEPLNFTVTRKEENPQFVTTASQAEVALQSARLPQNGHAKSLLGSRRLRVAVSSEPPPFTAFHLVLQGSRQAIVGHSFPLELSIKHDESAPALPPKPKVSLEGMEVKLRAHTSIRCSGSRCFKPDCRSIHKGEEFEDWDEEFLLDSWKLTGKEANSRRSITPMSRSLGLEILADNIPPGLDLHKYTVIPSYFIPSFRSSIISRTYSLNVSVTVTCAGKSSTYTFVTRNFLLLAKDFAPEPSQDAIASERTGQTLVSEDGMGPIPKLA